MGEENGIDGVDFTILKKDIQPPADRDESTVIFNPESGTVMISGVFLNGPTNMTIDQTDVEYDPEEKYLFVEIREEEKEGVRTAADIQQTIPYRVDIEFGGSIPSKVEVEHKRRGGKTTYEAIEEIF